MAGRSPAKETGLNKNEAIEIAKAYVDKNEKEIRPTGSPVKIKTEMNEALFDPVAKEYIMPVMKEPPEVEKRLIKRAIWVITLTYHCRPMVKDIFTVEIDRTSGKVVNYVAETVNR